MEETEPYIGFVTCLHCGWTCPGLTDLNFLRGLTPLRDLSLNQLEDVTDFSPIAAHKGLERLDLGECPALSDIQALPPLGNIESFGLSESVLRCGLEGLVEEIPRAEELRLRFSDWVGDLTPLTTLTLRDLGLWGCAAVEDLAPLAGQTRLRFLDLEGTAVHDLAPLAGLRELEVLWLKDCPRVRDLSPIAELPKLRMVRIEGIAPGADLAPLAGNRQLTVHVYAGQDVRNRERLGRRVKIETPGV